MLQKLIKNVNVRKHDGQTELSKAEKKLLAEKLQICAEWGYPLDFYGLRVIIKAYLDGLGKIVKKCKNNLPGPDFAAGFIKRHKEKLAIRL